MKRYLFLFSVLVCNNLFAQTDTTWFNKYWEKVATKDSAMYFRPPVKKLADGHYEVKDYYLSTGKLQMEGTFLTPSDSIGDGIVKYYHNDGTLKSSGTMVNDKSEGKWQDYFQGSGELKGVYNFKKSRFDGEVIEYYRNGSVSRKELWKRGKMKDGKCFTRSGSDTSYYENNEMPRFPGGDKMYESYMLERMDYSKYYRKNHIHGRVYIHAFFDETGRIYKTILTKSVHPMLDAEALRLVLGMPSWQPAIDDNGQPTQGDRTLDILFGWD